MEDIKTLLKKQEERIKRHIDVLKEDFDSKVQLIAEQYDSIREKLDSHDQQFNSIRERLDSHDQQFNSIREKLDSHDQQFNSIRERLDSHTEMIVSMKEDIEIMKVDIAFIKNSLKKKVDVEEFEALERRVIILEAKSRNK